MTINKYKVEVMHLLRGGQRAPAPPLPPPGAAPRPPAGGVEQDGPLVALHGAAQLGDALLQRGRPLFLLKELLLPRVSRCGATRGQRLAMKIASFGICPSLFESHNFFIFFKYSLDVTLFVTCQIKQYTYFTNQLFTDQCTMSKLTQRYICQVFGLN